MIEEDEEEIRDEENTEKKMNGDELSYINEPLFAFPRLFFALDACSLQLKVLKYG